MRRGKTRTLSRTMTRAQPSALSALLVILLAVPAAISTADRAFAKDSSRPYGVVVCTSEAKGPWTLRARGTLTRTKSETELIYRFESSEHAFDWRFITTPQGHTTVLSPGFLMERFNALPKQPEASPRVPRGPINAAESSSQPPMRRQSVEATGEIREYAGPNALVLLIGSKCPARSQTQRGK
jgi:hypothetical protein